MTDKQINEESSYKAFCDTDQHNKCRFRDNSTRVKQSPEIESRTLEIIIFELKQAIDQFDSDFRKAKDDIVELARILDEFGYCERSQISRKIKEMLQDKINEGKITAKWIHECLPPEYKREYNKRELSSLSKEKQELEKEAIASSSSEGTMLLQNSDDNTTNTEHASDPRVIESLKETVDNLSSTNHIIDFECSLPFEEVRHYMESIFRENKGFGKVYFHGTLDTRTGKATSVFTGILSNNPTIDHGVSIENNADESSSPDDTTNDSDTHQC